MLSIAENSSSINNSASKPNSFFRLLLKNRLAVIGLFFILLWTLVALFAPIVAPYSPIATNTAIKLQAPSVAHWMGTDNFGRDIISRVIYGARISLWTGLIGVGISCCIGIPLGGIAGYYGGKLGNVIMRVMDTLLAFPSLILAMAIAASIGPGLISAMIAVGIVGIPEFARLMFGQTVSLREKEFVEAGPGNWGERQCHSSKAYFPECTCSFTCSSNLGFRICHSYCCKSQLLGTWRKAAYG